MEVCLSWTCGGCMEACPLLPCHVLRASPSWISQQGIRETMFSLPRNGFLFPALLLTITGHGLPLALLAPHRQLSPPISLCPQFTAGAKG